jgi:Holliday junction DNA helicase RuvA
MYAYLDGNLTYKSPTHVHLECNGVGYLIHISLYTFSAIEKSEKAKLYTYLHVREDALILYGFSTEQEKEMFAHLISVSGVGPNTARLILSSLTTNELSRAIINEEVSLIQTIKGIGPKSAKRLVLELKDKVGSMKSGSVVDIAAGIGESIIEETIAALTMLGFARVKSDKIARKIWQANPSISVENLIKLSLKNL